MKRPSRLFATAWLVLGFSSPVFAAGESSELSNEPIPLQVESAPERPQPLEIGPPFLGTGVLGSGFDLPGGAVWQPQLLVWGTLRTAVQSFDPLGKRSKRISEWVNRLDVFAQIAVTQTERVVVGLRPFDDEGQFSGCRWETDNNCVDAFNAAEAQQEEERGQLETLSSHYDEAQEFLTSWLEEQEGS